MADGILADDGAADGTQEDDDVHHRRDVIPGDGFLGDGQRPEDGIRRLDAHRVDGTQPDVPCRCPPDVSLADLPVSAWVDCSLMGVCLAQDVHQLKAVRHWTGVLMAVSLDAHPQMGATMAVPSPQTVAPPVGRTFRHHLDGFHAPRLPTS